MTDAVIATELRRVAKELGDEAGVPFVLERPRDAGHGDLATNLALLLAKSVKQPPREVANRVVGKDKNPELAATFKLKDSTF